MFGSVGNVGVVLVLESIVVSVGGLDELDPEGWVDGAIVVGCVVADPLPDPASVPDPVLHFPLLTSDG